MKLTCFRISNGALAARDLPARLKILAWGDNPAAFGINPRMGEHTRRAFSSRMRARNLDKVPIDFEHNTVRGTPAHAESTEPRKVAGYGAPLLVPGDGLFLDQIDWTPCGKENAVNFIDLSPAVHLDPATGEVDLLASVALTRAGAVEGLSFYNVDANEGGDGMDWKKWLCGFLGLPEDTADEALKDALGEKIQAMCVAALATVNAELDAVSQKVATLSGGAQGAGGAEAITALTADLAATKGEVAALRTDLAKRDREAVVAQAAREGKVIPLSAEQIAAMDLAVLRELVGKLPVTVPVERRTPEHIAALSAQAASPALEAVARRCGMDPAKVIELNKAA